MPTRKTLTILAAAALVSGLAVTQADAAVILADEFADADRTGAVGTFGSWDTVSGISAPVASLAFVKGDTTTAVGFHDNALNDGDGAFDVNNNMTAGGWDTEIELVVGGQDLELTSLVIDIKLTNGSGAGQTTGSKSGQMLVDFLNASEVSVGSADLGGNVGYPSVSYTRTLDLTGITLSAGQTYTMVVKARGTGYGHHKALDAIELNGNLVPEPGSLALIGLGGLLIARRRRG